MDRNELWRRRRLMVLKRLRATQWAHIRGYWEYDSPDYDERDLDIDCEVTVPNEDVWIAIGVKRIQTVVARKLGRRVASKLHFGVSASSTSREAQFAYRRGSWGRWSHLD